MESEFLVLVYQLHVFAAKKVFSCDVLVAQLLRIVFRSIPLLKMIIREHTISTCSLSFGRTLSNGKSFPILLAAPSSC